MTRKPKERALTLRPHEVRVVLAGATQHWVPIRPQPERIADWSCPGVDGLNFGWMTVAESLLRENPQDPETVSRAPLVVGDRAWVRERFALAPTVNDPSDDDEDDWHVMYRVDDEVPAPWRSPIVMPRWASRITLEITAVRVARIQDVTEEDARAMRLDDMDGLLDAAEICRFAKLIGCSYEDCRPSVAAAWDVLHGRGAWDRNDWCWARTFRRVQP